ncbi:MAG: bacteriochlorophyll 4-vinyl reductase [Pseudomonadota bacterium]
MSKAAVAPGRIGPNAVIQLGEAMRALAGETAARALYHEAGCPGLLDAPPDAMIDQRVPAALFAALWRTHAPEDAYAIAADAGRRVADYVIANRMPAPARLLLGALPRSTATNLLLGAIARHAWTFAGTGRCRVETRPTRLISISDNPLAMPHGIWHAAVFGRLIDRLAAPGARIAHRACCREGAPVCTFEVIL